jgi:hypothetical protein
VPECEEYLLVAKEYIGGNIYLQAMSEISRSIEEIPPWRDIPDKSCASVREPHHCKEATDSNSKRQREVHRLSRGSQGQV